MSVTGSVPGRVGPPTSVQGHAQPSAVIPLARTREVSRQRPVSSEPHLRRLGGMMVILGDVASTVELPGAPEPPLDETAPRLRFSIGLPSLKNQYVASARCRSPAPMASRGPCFGRRVGVGAAGSRPIRMVRRRPASRGGSEEDDMLKERLVVPILGVSRLAMATSAFRHPHRRRRRGRQLGRPSGRPWTRTAVEGRRRGPNRHGCRRRGRHPLRDQLLVSESEIRWQNRATLARFSSADLVHTKGRGSSL